MRKILSISLTSIFLGITFDYLFFERVPGISVFIYTSVILAFTLGLSMWLNKPVNRSLYWMIPVTLFFAGMIFVRANPFLIFVNILIIIYLLTMIAHLSHQPKLRLHQYELAEYIGRAFWMPLSVLQHFFKFLGQAATGLGTIKSNSSLLPIIRGAIISLPILFIFLLLLSSADIVFKEFVTSIFNPSISPETFFRVCLAGFIASIFLGSFGYIFLSPIKSATKPKSDPSRLALGTTEASVILGSVASLFLIFVLIQVTYLFGGADHIVSTGHTYAEYARKGFFELIAVAAISLLLILAVKKTVKADTILNNLIFKWLSGALIVEVLVIMLSAHMRLNIYEDAYGFTALRLWSHLFIICLAAAFGLLLFYIVKEMDEKKFAFILFTSLLGFFGFINLINPDNFIARKNISRYNSSGKLDVKYLSSLSEDSAPAIDGLLQHRDEQARKSGAYILNIQKMRSEEMDNDWQSANISRHKAEKIYSDNTSEINSIDRFPDKIGAE